jgi:hypothetical protein
LSTGDRNVSPSLQNARRRDPSRRVSRAPTPVAELATVSVEGDPVVTADGLPIYVRSNRNGNDEI